MILEASDRRKPSRHRTGWSRKGRRTDTRTSRAIDVGTGEIRPGDYESRPHPTTARQQASRNCWNCSIRLPASTCYGMPHQPLAEPGPRRCGHKPAPDTTPVRQYTKRPPIHPVLIFLAWLRQSIADRKLHHHDAQRRWYNTVARHGRISSVPAWFAALCAGAPAGTALAKQDKLPEWASGYRSVSRSWAMHRKQGQWAEHLACEVTGSLQAACTDTC